MCKISAFMLQRTSLLQSRQQPPWRWLMLAHGAAAESDLRPVLSKCETLCTASLHVPSSCKGSSGEGCRWRELAACSGFACFASGLRFLVHRAASLSITGWCNHGAIGLAATAVAGPLDTPLCQFCGDRCMKVRQRTCEVWGLWQVDRVEMGGITAFQAHGLLCKASCCHNCLRARLAGPSPLARSV